MIKINLDDVLILKKKHACGGNKWRVIRHGADVKIECLNCGRVVMIDRPTLLKRIKSVL